MTGTALKRRVTKYFKARHAVLRTLTERNIASDDFFELYVLARIVARLGRPPRIKPDRGEFVVAVSPTTDWTRCSYFVLEGRNGESYGARTGLEVNGRGRSGTAELDVLVVTVTDPQLVPVQAGQVRLAYECKLHGRKIASHIADAVVGRAYRVWGLPVPSLGGSEGYAVVSVTAATRNALAALAEARIGYLRPVDSELERHIAGALDTLGIVCVSEKPAMPARKEG